MKKRSTALILVAALGLGACSAAFPVVAPDQPMPHRAVSAIDGAAFEFLLAEQRRLHAVALPVLQGAVEFCGRDIKFFFGLSTAIADTFEGETRDIAVATRGLDQTVRVLYTVPGSPAELAGLRRGDSIISVAGLALPAGEAGTRLLFGAMDASQGGPLSLTVRRDGIKRTAAVSPVAICDIPVELARTGDVFAWTNGTKVKIGEGMLRFAASDPELALVIAHELAHIILDHTGAFFNLGSARLEREADYVGLYILARAGFDLERGVRLFDRMSVAFPKLDEAASHPPLRSRLRTLRDTAREITDRADAGLPLVPDSYRAQLLGTDRVAQRTPRLKSGENSLLP